jgi:phosphatidylinositol alpha-mannosyltransferase
MRIALVSPYDDAYPGGVGRHVAALREQFRARGHHVVVIVPGPGDQREDEAEGIFRVGHVTPVPAGGSVARITLSPRMVLRVRHILDSQRFDVVHVHEPLMPALPPTVLRYSEALHVGTFHAFRHSYYGYRYGRPLLRLLFDQLHGRIAVSRAALAYVSQYFPGSYAIIPNGVDLRRYGPHLAPLERHSARTSWDDGKRRQGRRGPHLCDAEGRPDTAAVSHPITADRGGDGAPNAPVIPRLTRAMMATSFTW